MAHILLAEDDDAMRRYLTSALRGAGHYVTAVDNGLKALEQMSEIETDLLLADVVMPGLDGVELARRAAKDRPHLKVMFITGFAAVALNERQQHAAGTRVLSKPFHLRELFSEIEAMLECDHEAG